MISPEELVARAREHLTNQEESGKFTTDQLFALVPSALAEWIRRTEANPQKRRNFLVETEEIAIAEGVADCAAALDAKGIQSQFVTGGNVAVDYDTSPKLPVQFVPTLSRLTLGGIQDKFFLTAYFDGKQMFFRNPADLKIDTFDGTMRIRAVSVPINLEDVPASLTGELATILAEIAKKFNTDSSHKGEQINMQKTR